MTDFLIFSVPGKPQGKQRARRGRGGHFYTPKETRLFERRVAWAAKRALGWSMGDYIGPVELAVTCYFSDRRRRDADNVLKSVSDALNGVCYKDDSQIVRCEARRLVGEPRTAVTVGWLE